MVCCGCNVPIIGLKSFEAGLLTDLLEGGTYSAPLTVMPGDSGRGRWERIE